MAGQIKVDSINADSNLALKIANTAVAFIDSSGLRPISGNVNLDATATSKLYLPSANTVAIQTAGVTAVTVDSSQNVGIGTASPTSRLQVGDATVNTNNGIILGKYNAASEVNLPAIRQISAGTGNDLAIAATSGSGAIRFYTGGANSSLDLGTASNAERMRIDSSGNLLFNSGYGSVATAYGCRAWVNFNGTGTVAIRASGNVSSITDNGTGDYTVNFTTAMPDANYSYNVSASLNYGVANGSFLPINGSGAGVESAPTVSASRFSCLNSGASVVDLKYINAAFFR